MKMDETEYWKQVADSLRAALASADDEITSLQEELEDCRAAIKLLQNTSEHKQKKNDVFAEENEKRFEKIR